MSAGAEKKPTLIVTGAAGFIGCNFVRLALAEGYQVVALDSLTYAGHRENLAGLGEDFSFERGDIRDASLVRHLLEAHQPTGLLNFAAESHVDRSIENPLLFVETNVLGTATLLAESLRYWREQKKFRYLQVSTDEVYGALGETGQFSETTPFDPHSPYSASKAGADHLVSAWYHTYGLPVVTTHCSNNYGAFQFPEKLIPNLIRCALGGKPLPIYGRGENVRDWIHVGDHARGVLLAFEKGRSGKSYCFGGAAERKNIDLAHSLCQILDRKSPRADGKSYATQISFVTDRPGHDWRYAIDFNLARTELGFRPSRDFETGLAETVDWYLANAEWTEKVTGGKK